MTTPLPHGLPDGRLADLIRDAVDDIEPTDRLDAIRARTAQSPARAARVWWYAAGGTVLATAAAVTAFAVLGGGDARQPGPAHHDHATDPTHTTPFTVQLVPAYYPGETARGWRLFREFHAVVGDDPAAAALEALQGPADDADYVSPWPQGSFESARLAGGVIEVELGGGAPDAFAGVTEGMAEQQLVYTLQGSLHTQAPVQLLRDGEPVGDPIDSRPQNDVLNLVSISDPAEGAAYEGSFIARGRANSFEATVRWEIQDGGGRVVREGFATADGWMDRLYPWQTTVDLTGIPAGTYTFVVREDDPSGGAEGSESDVDTRTIVVR